MLSSLRPFPGASFEGNQRLSSVHHWCYQHGGSSIVTYNLESIFSLLILLFSGLICTEFAVKVMVYWWEGSCHVLCPVCSAVLAWLCFPCPFFSWQLPRAGRRWHRTAGDTEQEMMPLKPLPVVLVAAAEAAGVIIRNPNPKLFDSLLLIFAGLFFFSPLRIVSRTWSLFPYLEYFC